MYYQTTSQAQRRGSSGSESSSSAVENPFAYRSQPDNSSVLPPTQVYLRDSHCSSCSSSSRWNATHLVKLITLILVGFSGGLLYQLTAVPAKNEATTGQQEQLLQANDKIVHQLAAENQQHTLELERLRQELEQEEETTQSLRTRNQLIDSLEAHQEHAEEDPHALLWTDEVHEARLEDAHQQAEKLLKNLRRQPHDASEV